MANPTINERVNSREMSSGAITFHYRIEGTSSDATAMSTLLGSTLPSYLGLAREQNPSVEPDWVDTNNDSGAWNCTVRYVPVERTRPDFGEVTLDIDATGATQHITQTKQTIQRYTDSSMLSSPKNFHGAIGVSQSGPDASVDGWEVIVPTLNFTVTKVWRPNEITFIAALVGLIGKVNSDQFTVQETRTGVGLTFAPGTVLFTGWRKGRPRDDGGLEFSYSFSSLPNATGLTVGGITGIEKQGWQYLWVHYMPDASGTSIGPKPAQVNIERVYDLSAFAPMWLAPSTPAPEGP